jgi:hypothetical protein
MPTTQPPASNPIILSFRSLCEGFGRDIGPHHRYAFDLTAKEAEKRIRNLQTLYALHNGQASSDFIVAGEQAQIKKPMLADTYYWKWTGGPSPFDRELDTEGWLKDVSKAALPIMKDPDQLQAAYETFIGDPKQVARQGDVFATVLAAATEIYSGRPNAPASIIRDVRAAMAFAELEELNQILRNPTQFAASDFHEAVNMAEAEAVRPLRTERANQLRVFVGKLGSPTTFQ